VKDQVWLEPKNLKVTCNRKLLPKRYRPYQVIEKISPMAYQLQLPSSMKIHDVLHVDLLSPYSISKNCSDVLVIQLKVTISPWKHYEMLQSKMYRKALNLSFPVIYSVFVFVWQVKCHCPINLKNTSRQFFCSLLNKIALRFV
jgi:hypothetical protein